jgi:predicted flap endonuclease-1-like 5' DNA nuclease
MSMLMRVLKGSACRGIHHRLALEALTHLRGTDGALWRNLFLRHSASYLKGARTPDTVFRDFKNHVLHVREGDWGGAPAAAREWYRRTVRALAQQDWKHAAYCAGVMSHYVLDPVNPFHTGQTEEQNVIHRAVEWSITQSYDTLQLILVQDLGGYPDVPVPQGNDWLEQMVRAGAKYANPHYETLVDHFSFADAVKRPTRAMDQEMKDVTARLLGYATVMLARILERAFLEAAVLPPKVGLGFDTLAAVIASPMRRLLAGFDSERERDVVRAMYREFRLTGKVRETLPEDDRMVRRLHAIEVLRAPLSSIDALWPRETGTAHGTGRPARVTKKIKPARPGKAAATKKETPRVEPSVTLPVEPKAKPAQAMSIAERTRQVAARLAPARPAEPVKPQAAKPAPAPAPIPEPIELEDEADIRLSHESPVELAPSIGPKTASRLTAIGIHTVEDLLQASPEDAANRLKFKHISARVIRDWQAQATLALAIPEMDSIAAQLLVAVGVRDIDDLGNADPDMLLNMLDEFCETPDGQRILRDATPPDDEELRGWIETAQEQQARDADEDEGEDSDEDERNAA